MDSIHCSKSYSLALDVIEADGVDNNILIRSITSVPFSARPTYGWFAEAKA
jgi:hypothetical protein